MSLRTRLALAVVLLAAMATAACGQDEATDYTSAHRDAFLAACSRPLDDPRLLSDVCACVYDEMEQEIPFSEFERISEALESPSTPLPDEIAQAVADCFVREADL